MHEIVVAGHLCVDITPLLLSSTSSIGPGELVEIGPVTMALGGCVANTGGDLLDLGVPTRVSAIVGDDELGAVAMSKLAERGLRSRGLQITSEAETSYTIVLQPGGADRTIWHHAGANALFDGSMVDLSGAGLLHVGYPSLLRGVLGEGGSPLRRLFARAREMDLTTSLDLAVVDPASPAALTDWAELLDAVLPDVDVFTPSLDDLTSALRIDDDFSRELVEGLADRFVESGAAVVAISVGGRGLFLRTASAGRLASGGIVLSSLEPLWADVSLWQPANVIAAPATTNGAGDASTAGLLFGLLSGVNPESAALIAAGCAAAKISGERTTMQAVGQFLSVPESLGVHS